MARIQKIKKSKLKTGDKVVINAGKYKGTVGKIKAMLRERNRCIVENVAMVKKHQKATKQDEKSEIVQKEASINLSNCAYYDEAKKKGVKLGFEIKDGKKIRINKASKEAI